MVFNSYAEFLCFYVETMHEDIQCRIVYPYVWGIGISLRLGYRYIPTFVVGTFVLIRDTYLRIRASANLEVDKCHVSEQM